MRPSRSATDPQAASRRVSAAPAFTTFLFTDIEGSTRLWEREPERMRLALARHDAVCQAAVQAHRGRVVKGTGDGIHAVFDDPLPGVLAALQLQLDLPVDAGSEQLALRVRCGLHGGPVEHRDGDFFGSVVNRAARVMSVAHGGQTLLSQAVADRVAGRLPAGLSLADLGPVRLRDLSAPERVHQLQHARLRSQFPPLRSLESTPNNLAQQLNSLHRPRSGAARTAHLAGPAAAWSRCWAPAASARARLAVQLGADLLDAHPDGVWFVELAPVDRPAALPQALASVLGVKEEPGQHADDTLLPPTWPAAKLLLVLDNCEHLIAGAAARWPRGCCRPAPASPCWPPAARRCRWPASRWYPVPALGLPAGPQGAAATPDDLLRHDAVRLFVDRARSADPAFALDCGQRRGGGAHLPAAGRHRRWRWSWPRPACAACRCRCRPLQRLRDSLAAEHPRHRPWRRASARCSS
jgi:class 3 adenylate cyclase